MQVNEKYTRTKNISKEDESQILARLLSPDFKLEGLIVDNEKQYPSDSLHIPEAFDVKKSDYSKDLLQLEVIKIEDDELVIKPRPQPRVGFRISAGQLFFN